MWCIPPSEDASFVCGMEQVLDVYKRPQDPLNLLVCMDEKTMQCVKEVRVPQPTAPGYPPRYDGEYERNGVAHLLMFYAPLNGWRRVDVRTDHKAVTWADSMRKLVEEDYPEANRTTVVMDSLNTHTGASLYKAFPPEQARKLVEKLEFVYTPKHGSWLNSAECELSVISRQCLNRRLPDIEMVKREVDAWTKHSNDEMAPTKSVFQSRNEPELRAPLSCSRNVDNWLNGATILTQKSKVYKR